MGLQGKIVFVLCFLSLACATTSQQISNSHTDRQATDEPNAEPSFRVYLINETANVSETSPVLEELERRLAAESKESAVVFLGSVTRSGLPDSSTARRSAVESQVSSLMSTTRKFPGRTIVIPGEHDWDNDKTGGLDGLNRLEKFVDDLADRNSFRPDDGFPGPDVVKLTDGLRLLAIDSQWWLARNERPFGETDDYELQEQGDFLNRIEEMLGDYPDETLLIAAHHPLVSNGHRAGHYSLRTHLFPLTEIAESALIPLPIIGSLVPLYTRIVGRKQDLMGADYQLFRRALLALAEEHPRLIYAAGHESNAQYAQVETGDHVLHHVIPGAITKPTPVKSGHGLVYGAGEIGFSVLSYYEDGSTWLEVLGQSDSGSSFETRFRSQLFTNYPAPSNAFADPETEDYQLPADSVIVAANADYAAGPLKSFLLGAHHRSIWSSPVKVPVFDIGTAFGGLRPIKRGGGQQTVSLRLENADGRQYVLRSIDKRPENSIPEVFRQTIAKDVLRDQTSAQHPFGGFVVGTMADAIGVFHTNPELVYVPDDPRLGPYRDTFANQLVMLEDRPDDDMSDAPNYGFSSDVVSVGKLYEELLDDNDNRVDQRAFLRARLFDMLLSDWDRHRDQWRWAAFDEADEKIFRPIPRDRDWAFNEWDGLFPSLAAWFDPKFRGFKADYGSLKGLSKNGYEQDRRFLSSLERSDWIEIADSIRTELTDEVIEESFKALPESAHSISGKKLVRITKIRRDKLTSVGHKYYELHARVVDLVGSNKHEEFVVERGPDGVTKVTIYKIRKDGERRKILLQRLFLAEETNEIRLYGLGGDDRFVVSGNGAGIRVNIVGGTGTDTFQDSSSGGGLSKLTHVYDTSTGNVFGESPETDVRTSDDPLVNQYDQRGGYAHNGRQPALFFGLNRDDGLYLGGGLTAVRHGFRKKPYASSNKLIANAALKTGSFNAVYGGHFVSLIGSSDVWVDGYAHSPRSIRNFYGLGNETSNTIRDRSFYQAGIQRYGGSVAVGHTVGKRARILVGPIAQIVNVDRDTTRFVTTPQPGLSSTTFSNQYFSGAKASLIISTLDNNVNPHFGMRWNSTATYNVGLSGNTNDYTKLEADLALFLSLSRSPQFTTALRFGGRHTLGDFPFFDAATLGSSDNLRGYRTNRFAGRSSAYANAEIRFKLLNVSSILAIGDFGLLGFADSGRVWTDSQTSSIWHLGYGGGVWFNFANVFILQASVAFSDEGNNELIGLGFQF